MDWKLITLMSISGLIAGYYQAKILDIFDGVSDKPIEKPPLTTIMMMIGGVTLIFSILGNFISNKVGLGTPYLEALVEGQFSKFDIEFFSILGVVLSILLIVAIFFFVLYYQVFLPKIEVEKAVKIEKLGVQMGLLPRIFSGGIFEEIIFRYGQLSLIMWLLTYLLSNEVSFWIANIISTLFFGLAHLPGTKNIGIEPDKIIISGTLLLNGIIGLIFGYFYFTYGLIFAIIGHSGIHVIWVLLYKLNITKVHNIIIEELNPTRQVN